MERVGGIFTMRGRIRQRPDDLQLLDDRAGPPVGDDQRHRVRMLRSEMDEMDFQPVDLGDELRQGVQRRFAFAPIVAGPPVARSSRRIGRGTP